MTSLLRRKRRTIVHACRILAARTTKVVGMVALQDSLRAGARAAVQRLLDARIEPVLMSGEARDTCETIGRSLDNERTPRPSVLKPLQAKQQWRHSLSVIFGHFSRKRRPKGLTISLA